MKAENSSLLEQTQPSEHLNDSETDDRLSHISNGSNGGFFASNEPSVDNKRIRLRVFSGFWILGLCNNFAYVVMLSAAYDILESQGMGLPDGCQRNETKLVPRRLLCNPAGTGVVLLADILPSLVVKLSAPFYMHRISYNVKVLACLVFGTSSFLIVAFTGTYAKWLSIIGVACASVGSGFGEVVFLSFSSHFSKHTISSWSSGTGAAGIFGSLAYSGLTEAGLSPKIALLVMLLVPLLEAFSYYWLIVKPQSVQGWHIWSRNASKYLRINSEDSSPDAGLTGQPSINNLNIKQRILLIRPLLRYMVPLMLVYLAEYFINQALFELAYFEESCNMLSIHSQYRWYQTLYQLGVFLSRSSVSCFQVKRLWILPILQFGNVIIILCQVLFHYMPPKAGIWIMFLLVLWEGVLGGTGYVNTFYRITQEVPVEYKEFSLGVTSLADSAGIVASAFISIATHNGICNAQITWPKA